MSLGLARWAQEQADTVSLFYRGLSLSSVVENESVISGMGIRDCSLSGYFS